MIAFTSSPLPSRRNLSKFRPQISRRKRRSFCPSSTPPSTPLPRKYSKIATTWRTSSSSTNSSTKPCRTKRRNSTELRRSRGWYSWWFSQNDWKSSMRARPDTYSSRFSSDKVSLERKTHQTLELLKMSLSNKIRFNYQRNSKSKTWVRELFSMSTQMLTATKTSGKVSLTFPPRALRVREELWILILGDNLNANQGSQTTRLNHLAPWETRSSKRRWRQTRWKSIFTELCLMWSMLRVARCLHVWPSRVFFNFHRTLRCTLRTGLNSSKSSSKRDSEWTRC